MSLSGKIKMKRSDIVKLIYHEIIPIGLEFGSEEDEFLKW